jgi:hypothetical protein
MPPVEIEVLILPDLSRRIKTLAGISFEPVPGGNPLLTT